jgi:hypothetical protein
MDGQGSEPIRRPTQARGQAYAAWSEPSFVSQREFKRINERSEQSMW